MARVIAHFMQDTEREAARRLLPEARETEAFFVADADALTIRNLEREGLIVQRIAAQPDAGLRAFTFETAATRGLPFRAQDESEPNFYLIALDGPLLAADRDAFAILNVELLEFVPAASYVVRLNTEQVSGLRALHFVQSVAILGSETTEKRGSTATRGLPMPSHLIPPPRVKEMLSFDIVLHREEDGPQVMARLADASIVVAGSKGRKIRVYLLEGAGLDDTIRACKEVKQVQQYVEPTLHNDRARVILGVDRPVSADTMAQSIKQTGGDQIVGVADTGIDETHADFQGRIAGAVALGRPDDPSDPNGHGTHVAGSILGDGSASGGRLRGIAPAASLFFQSILRADGKLELPLDLGDLFDEAYKAGARVHNNSWGAATSSRYTVNASEVDAFVAKNRDMLVVISAGNEGNAAHNTNAEPGFVDLLSIGSPASCKNALSVGASRSDRTDGGYALLTWGEAWPDNFPDPPIAAQKTSGDINSIAAFSSRGPCDDRRIKPDVVAPGTNILSTRSSKAPIRNYWGADLTNNRYAYNGGTSMAAPLVAGCAVLVRQYYVEDRHHSNPSAALLKATLINSTRFLPGIDSVAGHPKCPNHQQGFGLVDMTKAIPGDDVAFRLEFIDSWALTPPLTLDESGRKVQYRFTADGPIRICLAWTDVPGRALQNNLDLFVENGARKWTGNADAPIGLNMPDPDNNVEIVRINEAPGGTYVIQITATNLLRPKQDFALVVTGRLTSALQRIA